MKHLPPTAALAVFTLLAGASALGLRLSMPEQVSWLAALGLFVAFLLPAVVPNLAFACFGAPGSRRRALWTFPNALLPIALAADHAIGSSDGVLLPPGLALVAITPLAAAFRGGDRLVTISLLLSGWAGFVLVYRLVSLGPGWARDDGMGRGFFAMVWLTAVGIYTAEVILAALARALLDRRRRRE